MTARDQGAAHAQENEWLQGVKKRVEILDDGFVKLPYADWCGVIDGFEMGERLYAKAQRALDRVRNEAPDYIKSLVDDA